MWCLIGTHNSKLAAINASQAAAGTILYSVYCEDVTPLSHVKRKCVRITEKSQGQRETQRWKEHAKTSAVLSAYQVGGQGGRYF